MSNEWIDYLSVAWQAANAAGEIIRANWQQPKNIDYKGAIDLVTSVDRECERKIVRIIQEDFPGHSILAEEETNVEAPQRPYRWIIDPLDGTTNFAHGYPQFCVSIALERNRGIIVGLVYDPLRRECFRAVRGQGASLNGQPIQPSPVHELDKALLATFKATKGDDAALRRKTQVEEEWSSKAKANYTRAAELAAAAK